MQRVPLASMVLASAALAQSDLREPAVEPGARESRAGWDDGFVLESDDGAHELRIGALLQTVASIFDSAAQRTNDITLQRMRIAFEGRIDQFFVFNVEADLEKDTGDLAEAWLGFEPDGELGRAMFGRVKVPFGLEEMTPRRHSDFVFFTAVNQFSPAEDHGVAWLGRAAGGHVQYGLSLTNGNGGDDENDDKDAGARIVWHPFGGRPTRAFPADVLQLGVAATYGHAESDLEDSTIEGEAKQALFPFEDGTALDGPRSRACLEAAWMEGPFALYGEFLRVDQEIENGALHDDASVEGFWIAASWIFTGESKRFSGVKPEFPLRRGARGAGAWQLAARYSELSFSDEFVDVGAILPEQFPDRVASFDCGLNWYATEHARVRAHALLTSFDERIGEPGARVSEELTFLLQLQLNF